MTTTVLTDEQIAQALNLAGVTDYADVPLSYDLEIARAVEQAVLQSPEIQARMEAYAASKVREAMKSLLHTMNGHGRAAHERFGESGKPYDEGRRTAYEQAAAEIRALIPPHQ